MKFTTCAVLLTLVCIWVEPSMAFYPSGRINQDISYSDIEIIRQTATLKVAGVLHNDTNQAFKFRGIIKFCNIHNTTLNRAKIYKTLPAGGKAHFTRYLDKNNYREVKHAHHIEWEVDSYAKPTAESSKNRESIGYASTRSSETMIQVAGNGKYNSDQFELKSGLYIVKVSHTGERHCAIWLHAAEGDLEELVGNGVGYILESKAVKIKQGGPHLFNVKADGAWTISMEYQTPKAEKQERPNSASSSGAVSAGAASTEPVIIKLKSGRKLKADSYWEEGGKLKVSIYGGTMSIDRNEVQEITEGGK